MRNWIEIIDEAQNSAGIQVWHGSPHDLETFSTDHIGNGEGHQAYGWGLYFAAEKAVADYYHTTLNSGVKYRGVVVHPNDDGFNAVQDVSRFMHANSIGANEAISACIEKAEYALDWMSSENDGRATKMQKLLRDLRELSDDDFEHYRVREGWIYAATIPEGPYLYWDKDFTQQPRKTQTILRKMKKLYKSYLPYCIEDDDSGEVIYRCLGNFNRNVRRVPDEDKQSSLDLLDHGIIGIAYLDEGSRESGEGTMNYVIFDGSLVNIHKA